MNGKIMNHKPDEGDILICEEQTDDGGYIAVYRRNEPIAYFGYDFYAKAINHPLLKNHKE